MNPGAVLVLGGALACWPGAAAPRRLRAVLVTGAGPCRRPVSLGRPPTPAVVAAGVALGAALAGAGGAVAAALLAVVVVRTRRASRRTHDRAATARALAEGLGSFAAELRAGAPPALAARTAARDQEGACARALILVEATARLGGDVPAALRAAASTDPWGADDLRRFAAAWALAERHGVGLAGLVEAVAVDLRARARFAGRLRAQVAGPRATATVLAVLPVLGVGLGQGIGAHPWAVLSGTGLGQVLLVVGVGLVGAGVEWTERIVGGVGGAAR